MDLKLDSVKSHYESLKTIFKDEGFSEVKKIGYPISVRTDSSQVAGRYVLLMVD